MSDKTDNAKAMIVWIGGFKYSIEYSADAMETAGLAGAIHHEKRQSIELNTQHNEASQRETALHEIIHGIDRIQAQSEERLTEQQVYRISMTLFASFNDPRNHEFWKYIFPPEASQ